jgi:hypothetical protein
VTEHSPQSSADYRMVSIHRADPPAGAEGSEWHDYVIIQGHNKISGCRKGTLASVTTDVEAIVLRLNERRLHKRGRTQLVMRPKNPAAS